MPKKMGFVPRDNDAETLHRVINITGETTTQFMVMWAGHDPKTGKAWEQSLVPKEDCTDDLTNAWNTERKARAQESRLRSANNNASVASSHTSSFAVPLPTTTLPDKRKRNPQEEGNANANSLSKRNSPAPQSRLSRNTFARKALPNDNSALLDRDSTDVGMHMDMSTVKIGPPSRNKRTILDHNLMDDAGVKMDMSKMKIGPPSRKKQKKQDCTTATSRQISPASRKRLADFDKDVLASDSDNLNLIACRINESHAEKDLELASEIEGKEGMQGSQSTNEQEQFESTFEADISCSIVDNEVGPSLQKNLKDASPQQEVIGGGQDGAGTSMEILSSQSLTVTQPYITAIPIELSNIAKTFGVSASSSNENAIVVLANQSTQPPTDTTINIISDLRIQASLAAGDILCVTITRWGGFRLNWIKLRSSGNAQRFRRAALNLGASFFCEHVHPDLYNAACSFPGSDSKEWVDPKGPRRKRTKKAKSSSS